VEKFELSDFSGGQQERFSAADFKPNEWARLKGFVVEDDRTIRSQWSIQDIGTWSTLGLTSDESRRASALAGLTTSSGVDYLFAWVQAAMPFPYGDIENGEIQWSLVYKRVSYRNAEPQIQGNPYINYTQYWNNKTLDDTTTDWQYVRKSDGSIVQYTNIYHTAGPRFICTVPYYEATGVSTTAILVNCTPANSSSTNSFLLYEGSGYSGSPIVVKEYTNVLPSATSDTDSNGDGVLDNGGALVVSSNIMPKANVGVWWRGQLILGDVEYFSNPVAVEAAHAEAYDLYVGVYKDWLAARDAYKAANGQTASYPITAPTAIATIQPNRGTDYIALYKTYILAWKAKFLENKATSSNVGFPTAPSPTTNGTLKRYRNGIWFSQPGTVDQFHPFAFTADVCPPDAQIVGFVPVEDGLLVITTSTTKDAVILLRGTSLGYMADDEAVINVRIETVKGAIGSKTLDSAISPSRASYWPQNAAAVYIGRDGGAYATNGNQIIKLDTFRATEPVQTPNLEYEGLAFMSFISMLSSGNLPTHDQVYAFKDYIFLSRGLRWYVAKQLGDGSFAWSELVYPFLNNAPLRNIIPRHMLDLGGNIYFIGFDSRVYRLKTSDTESDLSTIRGSITTAGSTTYPDLTLSTATLQGDDNYAKSFWHRVGVRVKQTYNSTTGTLKSIIVRDTPALAVSSNSTLTTLNTTVVERGELVAPTQGPSVEFSADIVFTGDVMVEGVTVYKHGKVPRRK
jgi:hypothetical protein